MKSGICIIAAVLAVMCFQAEASDIKQTYLTPLRVVTEQGCSDSGELLVQKSRQASLGSKHMCRMSTVGGARSSILLDFGTELQGGLEIVLGSSKPYRPARMHFCFGESVSEALSDVNAPGASATNDHAMRDFDLTVPRDGSIRIGNTGFRYVRVDLVEPEQTVFVQNISAISEQREYPSEESGSFSCSDPLLNRIWETGRKTVLLNMQDCLWDGIKRDRLVWVGDMYPEAATIYSCFADFNIIRRSLDVVERQFPIPAWINGMPAYSLWYILLQEQLYRHSGDKAYLESKLPYIKGIIGKVDSGIKTDGRLKLGSEFLDWPSSGNPDAVHQGMIALTWWSLGAADRILREFKDQDAELATVAAIKDRLGKSPELNPSRSNKQAAAILALSSLVDATSMSSIIEADGVHGFSTFYGYYMLETMAMAGEYGKALDFIREFWGAMLSLGSDTFWEDFNIEWMENAGRIDAIPTPDKVDVHKTYGAYCYVGHRHSLCHGWASGPTAWMSEHILGVNVLSPSEVELHPQLGGLEWAEGSYPLGDGKVLSVKVKQGTDGTPDVSYTAPKGVKIKVVR